MVRRVRVTMGMVQVSVTVHVMMVMMMHQVIHRMQVNSTDVHGSPDLVVPFD